MLCVPFLFLMWAVLTANAQQNETVQNANASVTAAVPSYNSKANRYWYGPNGVIDFFALVNDARATAALNTSSLFPSPSDAATVLQLLSSPVCPYTTNGSFYFTNFTAAEQFVCCHLTVLDSPGWDNIMTQLQTYFFQPGYIPYSFEPRVVDQLYNVATLRAIETESIDTRVCKDDLRIHNPETDILRAQLLGQILGVILRTYNYITARCVALQTCLAYPTVTTGCATNIGPILNADVTPNMNFVNYDLFFQNICGPGALAAFNTYQINKVSC
jgi:hypothetical protein